MKIDSYKCDICSRVIEENKRLFSFSLSLGKAMDASGNGYNHILRTIDICQGCNEEILQAAYDKGSFRPGRS